jgi:hypothetical protein
MFCCSCRWGETVSLNCCLYGPIFHPQNDMSMENYGGMILTGENRRTRRKTSPSANLYTRNPTRSDTGPKASLRDERQATNRLSHCTHSLSHSVHVNYFNSIEEKVG